MEIIVISLGRGLSETQYSFGAFQLLPGRRLLLMSGVPVRLGARPFDLLVALASRSGEIVEKTELIDSVWPNMTVDEGALRVHLSALRKVLQAGGLGRSGISTVPGRGYIMTVPVERVADARNDLPSAPMRRWLRLPSTGKRLFGRETTVQLLKSKLGQTRVLSIVGAPGIGKTSSALLLAESISDGYPDGVFFVDLASITDPALIWSAIANAAGVLPQSEDPAQAIITALLGKTTLLIVDNCEHLVEAAASVVGRLAMSLPSLTILATSREPLRAEGEWVHRLAPLDYPAGADVAHARSYPAIELLEDRARASNDSFALKDRDLGAAAELCKRLDGIPLAIELAASSIEAFGLASVVARLDDWFFASLHGVRTAIARHQTLNAALEWSFNLLPQREKTVLEQLAVFQGSMDLQMAIDVTAGAALGPAAAVEAIHSLYEKSLLSADLTGDDIEYRLLEITRAHILVKLHENGRYQETAHRHAMVLSKLIANADNAWDVQSRDDWVGRYERRLVDLRAALGWAGSEAGDLHLAATLLADSAPLWAELGLLAEYRDRLTAFLERIEAGTDIDARLKMRLKIAWAQCSWYTSGVSARVLEVGDEALDLAERLNAPAQQMQALWVLWNRNTINGRFTKEYENKLSTLTNSTADPIVRVAGLRASALMLHYQGRQDEAWLLQEQLDNCDEVSFYRARRICYMVDQRLAHFTLAGRLRWIRGYPNQAMAAAKAGVAYAAKSNGAHPMAYFLGFGACPVALWCGDIATAHEWTNSLIEVSTRHGFGFWRILGEMYARVIPALGTSPARAGTALPPDAEKQYPSNALQLFATFHTNFVASPLLSACEEDGGGWPRSEVIRAKALQSSPAEAERLLRRAIDDECRLGGRSWALRSAMSLARLLCSEGRATDAFRILDGIYSQFTEGFETLDLTQARILLAELGAQSGQELQARR